MRCVAQLYERRRRKSTDINLLMEEVKAELPFVTVDPAA